VVGCCEYGDEPSGSGTVELVNDHTSSERSLLVTKPTVVQFLM
jgi:hypothetical protein